MKKELCFFLIKRYYTIDIVSNRKIKHLNIKAYLPTLETEFKTVKLKTIGNRCLWKTACHKIYDCTGLILTKIAQNWISYTISVTNFMKDIAIIKMQGSCTKIYAEYTAN